MKEKLEDRIKKAVEAIKAAEYILIGGGAGLSDAAGLKYSGKRFTDNFEPFIEKYGMEDLYSSSFYPFNTQEEKWAYWAKHISVNRYDIAATQLYIDLLRLVKDKKYFVITTNVEHQFYKAGFSDEKIFAVQGDYGYFQCAEGCHDTLYYNEELIKEMIAQTALCQIPSKLVPKCPVCGEYMDINIRKDQYFVQDAAWYQASGRYSAFLKASNGKNIVFLELGVGFNTPGIIRFPFEKMTCENEKAVLIRVNKFKPEGTKENIDRTIAFNEDMVEVIAQSRMDWDGKVLV